jgi:hypothetical protein
MSLKWKDRSEIRMGYGVSFQHQGSALFNLGNFDLILNVSLRALDWSSVSETVIQEFDDRCQQFTEEQDDVKLMCGYLYPMYELYRKRNHIFAEFVNNELQNEIPLLMPGLRFARIPEAQQEGLNETWYNDMRDTLQRHLKEVMGEETWRRISERFVETMQASEGKTEKERGLAALEAATWLLHEVRNGPGTARSATTPIPILRGVQGEQPQEEPIVNWNLIPRRMNLWEELTKVARVPVKYRNFSMPAWANKKLLTETRRYRTYWRSVYRITINERRVLEKPVNQVIRDHPELFRDLYGELLDAVSAIDVIVGDRVHADGDLDLESLATARVAESVQNSLRITFLPATRNFLNAWTKLTVEMYRRRLAKIRRLHPGERSIGYEKLETWMEAEFVYWRSAPTGTAITTRIRDLVPQRQKRQIVAIGLGLAGLIGAAVSATSSQLSMNSMSKKIGMLEANQARQEAEFNELEGQLTAVVQKTLDACTKLQAEIKETREELNEVGKTLMEIAREESRIKEEIMRMHVAMYYVTDATARLIGLMMKEMALQGYYMDQLRNLKESIQRLQQGFLPESLISPRDLSVLLARSREVITRQTRTFVPVFETAENYYKVQTTEFAVINGSLVINVKIPLRRFNDPIHDIFRTKVVPVPFSNEKDNERFTTLQEADTIFGIAHSSYAEITQEQLDKCVRINKLYLCLGTLLTIETESKFCLGAIFNRESSDAVKKLCRFQVTETKKIKPQILETNEEVLMANLPPEWSFQCDKQDRKPSKVKPGGYVLLNKNFLCHCSIKAGDYLVTQNIQACGNINNTDLSLSFSINQAAGIYNLAVAEGLNLEDEIRLHSPVQVKVHAVDVIKTPEWDVLKTSPDSEVLGDLRRLASMTERKQRVHADIKTRLAHKEQEGNVHRWTMTAVLVGMIVFVGTVVIVGCVWGKSLKSRFKDLQLVSLLRSNWQRRSSRLREQRNDTRRVSEYLKTKQSQRLKTRGALRTHMNKTLEEVEIPQIIPMDEEPGLSSSGSGVTLPEGIV